MVERLRESGRQEPRVASRYAPRAPRAPPRAAALVAAIENGALEVQTNGRVWRFIEAADTAGEDQGAAYQPAGQRVEGNDGGVHGGVKEVAEPEDRHRARPLSSCAYDMD